MQDADFNFLNTILADCEGRQQCLGCQHYYLCYPAEASPLIKKLQKEERKRFNRAMRKLEKASEFCGLLLDELHKVF